MRHFNKAGLCVPDQDYMVDLSGKLAKILPMIDKGQYFTINRARQYGKTTTLSAIRRTLYNDYICLSISFASLGDSSFASEKAFVKAFLDLIQRDLPYTSISGDSSYIESWNNKEIEDFPGLRNHISKMCEGKKIILMIDEVDRSSNNRIYIHFLAMLRDKYLIRKDGRESTFHSVILAGVYDIRNIKLKMINEGVYSPNREEGSIYNSPWNIAADFNVDMSFSAAEIGTMLAEYEKDHHTGMDIKALSELIRYYTSGYPYLVSDTCLLIDERLDRDWSLAGVEKAVKLILNEKNTLFDDMFKNLENYKDLYDFIYRLLMQGDRSVQSINNPVIDRALMFAFIKQEGNKFSISNKIYEIVISDYFVSKDILQRKNIINGTIKRDVITDGRFDMELAIRKFAREYHRLFSEKDIDFIERQARFLFICYLAPLLNGEGFYHFESELADQRRMDIVADYGKDEFIIELKIWRGEVKHKAAYDQLAGYLKSRGADTGYLITFDLRQDQNRETREKWIEYEGFRIFDVMA